MKIEVLVPSLTNFILLRTKRDDTLKVKTCQSSIIININLLCKKITDILDIIHRISWECSPLFPQIISISYKQGSSLHPALLTNVPLNLKVKEKSFLVCFSSVFNDQNRQILNQNIKKIFPYISQQMGKFHTRVSFLLNWLWNDILTLCIPLLN